LLSFATFKAIDETTFCEELLREYLKLKYFASYETMAVKHSRMCLGYSVPCPEK
jgi:hypothetical protein